MAYKPKVVTGKVTGTGWPIDGHVLYFSQWDYDNYESWHLYGWVDEDDEAVMLTMYQTEKDAQLAATAEAEFIGCNSLEAFTELWKSKQWEPAGAFCLPLGKVEVVEVKQEEEKDELREKLRARGIDFTPRKNTDEGGIVCLPMEKNFTGNVKGRHPDWELIDCPGGCGRKCWKMPGAAKLEQTKKAQLLCTECALEAGIVAPYRPDNAPKPGGNREQRRRARRGKRR